MSFSPAHHHRLRFWLTLLCGMTIALSTPALAAQPGPEHTVAQTGTPAERDAAAIQARIAVVSARTDISVQERDMVLKQLQAAASRLTAAQAARKTAHDYAAALQSAPETIAALNAESALASPEPAPNDSGNDPVRMQLKLASLQAQAVTLRSTQRDLVESLANMANRPDAARAELADLHRQLDEPQTAAPANTPPLMIEATHLQSDAARQELSARIDKVEQELLSLPTRESIATARRDLAARRVAQVDSAIAALNAQLTAHRQRETDRQAAQAQAFARRLAGQPAALREYADKNAEIRVSLKHLSEHLEQARGEQRKLRTQQDEVTEARKNAEEILAIGRISDESGRLLRGLQANLLAQDALETQIAKRKDALVDARFKRLQIRQELRTLEPMEAAATHYLADQSVEGTATNLALMTQLVQRRRFALTSLGEAQGQLITVLAETNALDVQLMQSTGQLRLLLNERLLWLPSAAPLGAPWLQQLGVGILWLVAPANWSEVPAAVVSALLMRWPAAIILLAAIIALCSTRSRLAASLAALARPVRHRNDNVRFTLLACGATLLIALTFPLIIGAAGWLLSATASFGSFAYALGHGMLGVAIVLFMLGLFIDMCRAHGVFVAHFGWSVRGTLRLARALRLLLLAIVPAGLLIGITGASGRSDLSDGLGRLGFMFGSLALALFLYRVFRPRRGAMTGGLKREGWAMRTRFVWSTALVAIPLLLAGLAGIGYYVTATELQSRLFTSGWIVLAVVIVFSIVMRGVLVVSRRTAWRQVDARHARAIAESAEKTASGERSDTLNLQNQEPEIDTVAVSQQTRTLLRAISGVVLVVLLWSIWSSLVPALNVFNNIPLWSHMVSASTGDKLAVVTLGDVLLSLFVLMMTAIAARNLPGFLELTLLQRLRIDSGTRYAIGTIGRYLILGVGLVTAFGYIGTDWSQLKWIVAALGVGLGFGLQEIVANFISGLIILFERPVRVGDLVSIGPTTGTVSRIKIRAITITDFDNFEVIVPNKAFITETVQNWSLTNEVTRLLIKISVAYGSDVEQTQQIILNVATANPQVLASPSPSAYFLRFGEHALEFELRVYVGAIDQRLLTRHQLHVSLTGEFKHAGIEILFPQRDLQVRYPDSNGGS